MGWRKSSPRSTPGMVLIRCGMGRLKASPRTAVFASFSIRARRAGEMPEAISIASGMPEMPK
ncbi:hypothetical protein D3C81_2167140 [compost metagenome]